MKCSYLGRINGYQVNIDNYSEQICNISTGDYKTCTSLGMKERERGVYVDIVKTEQFECVWTMSDYVVTQIIKGTLLVDKLDLQNTQINRIRSCAYYAIYKERKYYNIQGCNNQYIYELISYDIESQNDGFIMYSPGIFRKMVKPLDIDIEYMSRTWCRYKNKIFTINENDLGEIWIEPYSRANYSEQFLLDIGFFEKNTKLVKQVTIDDISDLWVLSVGTGQSKGYIISPSIIKGTICDVDEVIR